MRQNIYFGVMVVASGLGFACKLSGFREPASWLFGLAASGFFAFIVSDAVAAGIEQARKDKL